MEKRLKELFEYQRFAANPELQSVIDNTNMRLKRHSLSDNDMDMVSAAGTDIIFVHDRPNVNNGGIKQ